MISTDYLFKSYLNLRTGIVVLTILLPIILIFGGKLLGIDVQNSLSSYYHAYPEDCAYTIFHELQAGQYLRVTFVGLLFAVGTLLYLYKGLSNKENIALNLAGVFAILVATFPMAWESMENPNFFNAISFGSFVSLHGLAAVLLVLCIAYVCIFRPSKTVELITDVKLRDRYKIAYNILGVLMILLPATIYIWSTLLHENDKLILILELIVLIIFALFWWLKSKEYKCIGTDKLMEHYQSFLKEL